MINCMTGSVHLSAHLLSAVSAQRPHLLYTPTAVYSIHQLRDFIFPRAKCVLQKLKSVNNLVIDFLSQKFIFIINKLH